MIQWNADLVRRLACTEDEKADLASRIRALVGIASKARIDGIKVTASSPEALEFPLMKYGFTLIAEGIAGDALEDILAVLLAVEPSEGYEFLVSCLVAETLLSIASGDGADLTLRKLAAYCGAEKALALLEDAGITGQSGSR